MQIACFQEAGSYSIYLFGVRVEKTPDLNCRHLWNKALADRKNAWEHDGITRSYEDQAALLVFQKQLNPYLNAVHSQVEQDVLRRLQKSF